MSLGFSFGGVDVGGSELSSLGGFSFNAGGGGNFFSAAAGFAGEAFNWLNDSPAAANLLGGVASGVGQAYIAAEDREQAARDARLDRELQRELQEERLRAQQIAPGDGPANYGSYGAGVTRGLLSDGLLARADEED